MVTTIQVSPAIRDRLKRYGHAGMTYDDILQMFMDRFEETEFVAQIRREADRLDAEGGWESLD